MRATSHCAESHLLTARCDLHRTYYRLAITEIRTAHLCIAAHRTQAKCGAIPCEAITGTYEVVKWFAAEKRDIIQ
jgi:hypothetical protein